MDSPGYSWISYSMRFHIHAWNMAGGNWMKYGFVSAMSMAGWYMEVPNLVRFSYD